MPKDSAKKLVVLVASALVVLSLSGCATLFKGSTQVVPATSDPAGAKVYVDGVLYGTTPLQLKLKTNKDYTITFKKGGVERTVTVTNQIGALWVVLDFLSGVGPLVVDAATGAWFELQPDQVHVILQ